MLAWCSVAARLAVVLSLPMHAEVRWAADPAVDLLLVVLADVRATTIFANFSDSSMLTNRRPATVDTGEFASPMLTFLRIDLYDEAVFAFT